MQRKHTGPVIAACIALAVFIPVNGCDHSNQSGNSPDPGSVSIDLMYEKIPGSTHHSPNGTWWGYNQSKIVRKGDYVFMAVVENDNIDNGDPNADNPSHMAIYVKEGDGDWTKGASFPCSRPGNVVIGSDGILHAIVFEPTSLQDNGSIGKLMHYSFPDASSGDINTYTTETVIDNDGSSETVNIRVGAAMSPDDTLAVAFGLNVGANHTEQLYYKQSSAGSWTNLTAGEHLGHDFYYPYVVAEDSNFWLLPIQDDYNPATGGNFYQIIPIFSFDGTDWTQSTIIDLTSHWLASERERRRANRIGRTG